MVKYCRDRGKLSFDRDITVRVFSARRKIYLDVVPYRTAVCDCVALPGTNRIHRETEGRNVIPLV
jgi:hypothetical protein